MKNIFAMKKKSLALQLCLQLCHELLSVLNPEVDGVELQTVLIDNSENFLSQLRAIKNNQISDTAYETLCNCMNNTNYDPVAASRESESGVFLDLHHICTALRESLDTEHNENKRLYPSSTFLIGVDGSRQSYRAFEVSSRLRRQGKLMVIYIDEAEQNSIQFPIISKECILREYKGYAKYLAVPESQISVTCEPGSTDTVMTVASQLLQCTNKYNADFLVLGAIGKGGPAVHQIGHVPLAIVKKSKIPIILVPPSPVATVLKSSETFLLVVEQFEDTSILHQFLNISLKLLKPADTLRLIYFYTQTRQQLVAQNYLQKCQSLLAEIEINVILDTLLIQTGETIVECLQDYIKLNNVTYLFLSMDRKAPTSNEMKDKEDHPLTSMHLHCKTYKHGIHSTVYSMLLSPRCNLILIPLDK